jgi:hypothetical protein
MASAPTVDIGVSPDLARAWSYPRAGLTTRAQQTQFSSDSGQIGRNRVFFGAVLERSNRSLEPWWRHIFMRRKPRQNGAFVGFPT